MIATVVELSKTDNATMGVHFTVADDKGAVILDTWRQLAGFPATADEALAATIDAIRSATAAFLDQQKSILVPEVQKIIGLQIDLDLPTADAIVAVNAAVADAIANPPILAPPVMEPPAEVIP